MPIEHVWLDDRSGEYVGTGLRPDFQCVGKAACDDEGCGDAFAFEERVCRDGGAHFDRGDAPGGNGHMGREPEELADGVESCVVVGGGVDGEDLGDVEAATGIARDDIGERAAAVDVKLPFRWSAEAVLMAGVRCGAG